VSLPERSNILATAFRVPETAVTNDELAAVMDTSDDWIRKRSGIEQRHYVDNDQGSSALAEEAAREAIAKAGLGLGDIDLVVCATLSSDVDFPGNSSLVCERLGLAGVPAFDVSNQCSGFLYMLAIADQYIRTGGARHVLIIGSEVHSTGLDYTDRGRGVTVLFGDGAGAAVIGPSTDPERGLLAIKLHAEGAYAEKLCLIGPSGRRKPRIPEDWTPADAYHYPVMDGKYVFKHAVTRMAETIVEVLEATGMSAGDIDMLVPHQANLRINQMVASVLEIDESHTANNIQRYGNTTAATIPILLTETVDEGRIKPGDLVCVAAFGAGFTWGAALLRW
jgi:3-oxoacyl-[acyl-carrier-protein] synthase-3